MRPVTGRDAPSDQPARETGPAGALTRWPLRGRSIVILLVAYVTLSGVGLMLGFLLTGPLVGDPLLQLDGAVANWLAGHRQAGLTDWMNRASLLSDTFVITGALLGFTLLYVWRRRRWGGALLLDCALALEGSVFLTVSMIVARHRPAVVVAGDIPPTAGFPSGHVGAATAFYLGIAYLIVRGSANRLVWSVATGAAIAAIVTVTVSRLYLGMHFVSDVVVALAYGGMCLLVALWAVRDGIDRHGDRLREEL